MEILQNCQDHAHKYYGDLLLAAEKTLADTLFEHAEQCTSNQDQRRYFEAMQELKQNSSNMHTAFKNDLRSSFEHFIKADEPADNSDNSLDLGGLSLVHRDQLESDLAISVIVSKSNSRNSEALWKLNRRMAVIRGGKSVDDETNPFAPTAVCHALQAALAELTIDSKAKILLYKQLGRIFVISFAKELAALNEILVNNGILSNLRFEVSKEKSSQPEATAQPNADQVDRPETFPTTETQQSIVHQQELYSAIRELQSSSPHRTQTAGGVSFSGVPIDGAGGVDTFSSGDYALALSAIQQSKAFLSSAMLNQPLPAEAVEEKLFGQLAKQGDDNARHKMTKSDAETVDLVGMIFRYMLEDPNLHDSVKALLSHLHTPYLKMALMDKSFLDNYHHNARVLLNTMAEVGGKWVKKEQDRTVLPKIKATVEAVLKGFIDDDSIFEQLLEDFLRFKENLEKRSQMVEKRNTESQQGLEKLDVSKQRASDEFDQRAEQAQIPENVVSLLRKSWSDFLSFNLLRHGEKSLSWESALKVVDGVIWSVQPSAVADNKTDFQRHQADMEKSVSDGLHTIGYDPAASKNLMSALKDAQELAYHSRLNNTANDDHGKRPSKPIRQSEPVTSDAKSAAAVKKSVSTPLPSLTPEQQSITKKLEAINFGTWFEFERPKTNVQLKLAWFSRVSNHYMFVDQTGVKQSVEKQLDLANGIIAGTIRIVEPNRMSFMERALEAVLQKLRLAT
ncbi:MAG: DUF1631 domain-containing protein [Oceanicoccus sp.]